MTTGIEGYPVLLPFLEVHVVHPYFCRGLCWKTGLLWLSTAKGLRQRILGVQHARNIQYRHGFWQDHHRSSLIDAIKPFPMPHTLS